MTPLDFARALLHRLSIPASTNRLVGLVAFAAEEGGHWYNGAKHNPMNTTLGMPGAINAVGAVKAYPDWTTGIEATARTMAQDNMRPIVAALKADASPREFLAAITKTPWCPQTSPGCQAYENADPYALYKSYANKDDGEGGALALKTPWLTYLAVGGLLALAGATAWYIYTGRRPHPLRTISRAWGAREARENPVRRRRRRARSNPLKRGASRQTISYNIRKLKREHPDWAHKRVVAAALNNARRTSRGPLPTYLR